MRTALLSTPVRTALLGLCALGLLATSGQAGAGTVGSTERGTLRTAAAVATATNGTPTLPPTPGNFTGYGFDQCLAPSQRTMDTWLASSPYLAVGIYVSEGEAGQSLSSEELGAHGTQVLALESNGEVPAYWDQETSSAEYAADIEQMLGED